MNFCPPIATVTSAAKLSALMFYLCPSSPRPTGETTGTYPCCSSISRKSRFTCVTSPTWPRSRPSCTSLRARMSPPSLPETPTASALPFPLSSVTSSVLLEPVSTISTTLTSAALVTRWPSTNSALPPSFSSVRVISGPPPCTTTGRNPTARSRRMSSQNDLFSDSFTIAAPPYLITQRVPENFWMYPSASTSSLTLKVGL